MFIIKFNNMVKNKWVWAAFAIVVAFAFGASDIFSARARVREGDGRVGRLGGKPVDPAAYDNAARLLRGDDSVTSRDVWKRLAALETARRSGISVSDAQLARAIRNDPSFHGEDGAFDPVMYERLLRARGFTPVAYQEAVRAELTIRLLQALVSGSPWAAPSVVEDRARGLGDVFMIRQATLSDTHDAKKVDIKPEEIRNWYDSHAEAYRVPERRKALYVAFKASEFDGSEGIVEDDINEYYDANAQSYVVKGEDGEETQRPIEEVSDEIRKALASQRAADMAYRAAAEFADVYFDRQDQNPDDFDFAADVVAAGRTVVTTDWFSADSAPSGVPAGLGRNLTEAVFELDGGSVRDLVTDAIGADGRSAAVVAFLFGKEETRIPPQDEIAAKVENDARADKASRLFQDDVAKANDAISRSMADGADFIAAAEQAGLAPGTNFVFSWIDAQSGATPVASPRAVAQSMIHLGVGDMCPDPIGVPGGVLFFQVVGREPQAGTVFGQLRDRVQQTIEESLGEAAWNNWLEANLDAMQPEPAVPFDAPEDGEEEA